MKTGTFTHAVRLSPLRRRLMDAQVPEPLKRKQWTEEQTNLGYAKWLEFKYPDTQIARVLGLEYALLQQVFGMYLHRKVPAIKPPAEILERFA